MSRTSRLTRAVGTAATTAAMVVGTVVAAPTVARADSIDHYYIEIGGTTGAADQPECTTNYRAANHKLQSGSGGTPAGPRVGIPAS